jgi:hypothetical protein
MNVRIAFFFDYEYKIQTFRKYFAVEFVVFELERGMKSPIQQ